MYNLRFETATNSQSDPADKKIMHLKCPLESDKLQRPSSPHMSKLACPVFP